MKVLQTNAILQVSSAGFCLLVETASVFVQPSQSSFTFRVNPHVCASHMRFV
ncbi:MAG TPA: hypothetical protein PK299_15855 [Anaerolineales bacterium]|nr:hypothetical protein [Anaerolineales bacterium]